MQGTEDYLHDDDGLLDYVADAGTNKVQKHVHATFGGIVYLDGCLTNGFDTLAYKVHVDL